METFGKISEARKLYCGGVCRTNNKEKINFPLLKKEIDLFQSKNVNTSSATLSQWQVLEKQHLSEIA